jgi:hypothetical protein
MLLAGHATPALGEPEQQSGKADERASSVGSGSRPNLILFIPHELRADALACFGNRVASTPIWAGGKIAERTRGPSHACARDFPRVVASPGACARR